MVSKQDVLSTHRANPDWTAPQIAEQLGCNSAYVRATARRNGVELRKAQQHPKQIRWSFEEHWSGEKARFSEGRITAFVRDFDGDSASWLVSIDGDELSNGQCWDFQSFDTAIACAELAIRAARRDVEKRPVKEAAHA